jgi:hypothetical protein
MANGEIPPGMWVLHHCDNPPCVRPDHLFLGTQSDNMQDMIRKGRMSNSKLSESQVTEIRQQYGRRGKGGKSSIVLGREYGMSPSTIRQIVSRLTWKHIP